MRTMERSKSERRRAATVTEPIEPMNPGSLTTIAVALAVIAMLGFVLLIAAAFFATVGLLDALV